MTAIHTSLDPRFGVADARSTSWGTAGVFRVPATVLSLARGEFAQTRHRPERR